MVAFNPTEDQRFHDEWDAGWAFNEHQMKDEIAEKGHDPTDLILTPSVVLVLLKI